jgi:hypothetical protein
MEFFYELLGSPWFMYAQMAFTVAMLVHVYRNGSEQYWFWIVLFFQPIGAWIYFIAVFIRNFSFGRGIATEPWAQKKLSLRELRYRAERTPTVANRMALAERLIEKGQHAEAIPMLEEVVVADPILCKAMYDLAVCHLACNEPRLAVGFLKKLLARDFRWSNYRAWPTLIDAHVACGEALGALHASRELAKMMPTLENKCVLAEHLIDNKLHAEAAEVLDRALEDYAYLPFGKRWKNWFVARRAQKLLAEADKGNK